MPMHSGVSVILQIAVIAIGAIVTAFTIVMSIYWCIRPGETDPNHPKRSILRNDR